MLWSKTLYKKLECLHFLDILQDFFKKNSNGIYQISYMM